MPKLRLTKERKELFKQLAIAFNIPKQKRKRFYEFMNKPVPRKEIELFEIWINSAI